MIAYLLAGAGACALVMFGASITWPVAYRAGRRATDDDTRLVEGVRLLNGYPKPIHRRLSDEVTHPEPMWEAEEIPDGVEGWPTGIRFYPPELLAPTEKVYRRTSPTIVSHRAPEGWRTVLSRARRWLSGLVERIRAWPLEPASSFAEWWRKAEHVHKHAIGGVRGATTQVARWNCGTGEYPEIGRQTEWDVEMQRLVDEMVEART